MLCKKIEFTDARVLITQTESDLTPVLFAQEWEKDRESVEQKLKSMEGEVEDSKTRLLEFDVWCHFHEINKQINDFQNKPAIV